MSEYGDYRGAHICPVSGAGGKLYRYPLIPYDAANEGEAQVASKEWVFGIPRGSLSYYLQSRENYVYFREDIWDLFAEGQFILAPTYKTYLDTMDFLQHAGVKNRKANDKSPRRQLTALTPPSGTYRYVFIPRTDAARAIQKEYNLQPQTREDLNGGTCPIDNAPYQEGSDQFPVIECPAHPFSICSFAHDMLLDYSTPLTSQWTVLSGRIINHWLLRRVTPPQWFIDSPKYSLGDDDLSPSEATGYGAITPDGLQAPEPISVLQNSKLAEDSGQKKAARWTLDVGPDADPPEDEPPRVVYAVRRSRRIQERAHPYRSSPSPCRGPPHSPIRNAARALLTCKRNPVKNPPSWASQNGRYPSHRFTSNDWAFFQYGVYLATPVET